MESLQALWSHGLGSRACIAAVTTQEVPVDIPY